MAPAHLQLANLYLQRHDYGAAKVQLQTYLANQSLGPAGSRHQENAGRPEERVGSQDRKRE